MTPTPQRPARLLVAIVNYRTPRLTIDCLRSLEAEVLALGNTRVVVADNASGDGSEEQIAEAIWENSWSAWASLLPLDRNGGFSYGNNAVIRAALEAGEGLEPEFVLLLNPDTRAHPGALGALLDFMESHPEVGIAGSRVEEPDGTQQHSRYRFHSVLSELDSGLRLGVVSHLLRKYAIAPPLIDVAHPADWVVGASMLVRRQVFDDIGLLDANYFLYFEEADFCLNAQRAGWQCWYVPASRVVHLVGCSSGITNPVGPAMRRPRYWFESRRRYFVKNHGRTYALCADAAWVVGFALWRVRRLLQAKPDTDPPHMLWDFLRFRTSARAAPAGNGHSGREPGGRSGRKGLGRAAAPVRARTRGAVAHPVVARLALVLMGGVCGLVAAELYVRAFGSVRDVGPPLTEYDPEFGKRLKRDFACFRTTPEFRMRFTSNSLGWRGPEPTGPRSEIVFLGDSFAMGYGVDDGEEFPQLLADELSCSVANLALGGTGPSRWPVLLRDRIGELDPRVVVLQLCSNDVVDVVSEGLTALDARGTLVHLPPPGRSVGRRLQSGLELVPWLGYSHLLGLLRETRIHASRETEPARDPEGAAGPALARALLEQSIASCRERSWQVVVLSADMDEAEAAPYAAVCAGAGVPFVRMPSKREEPELYYAVDPHWSEAGHRRAAELLAPWLR